MSAPELQAGSPAAMAFLQSQLAQQPHNVQRHAVGDARVWVKRAGPALGRARGRVLAVVARLLRLPVLAPVPNPGGSAAIATEARRLQDLRARGLRVPEVLAVATGGFLMRDLGAGGDHTPSLAEEIERAGATDPAQMLALWALGLQALAQVHAAGTCLSQGFARNMVRGPDGVVGFIDFEDDPQAVLPLPVCQARDLLCYAHSTALLLREAGCAEAAAARWRAHVQAGDPAVAAWLAQTVARLRWARRLPADRRWGRDALRLRAAYDLLAAAHWG